MHVDNTFIAWGDQFFLFRKLKDCNMGFEFSRLLAVVEVVADHISSPNVVLFYVFNPNFDIVACIGIR